MVMANLSLLAEDGLAAERWELGDQPLAVGRGATADVIVDDAALSRRHFLILKDAAGYLLKDLDSQNGTWVDGQPAKATRLHHHDCILAGRTLFMFSETAPAPINQAA
jgi:two-component system, NtrC family, sensor kinase